MVLRTSKQPRKTGRTAFTLMEVLASLILVSIVVPIAMSGISVSMENASQARHMSEAGELIVQKLNEYALIGDTTQLTGSGDFGANFPEYTWTSTYAERDFGIYEVIVTVSWNTGKGPASTTMSTFFYPTSTTTSSTSSSTSTGGG